jgi:hypothetical protein
MSRFLRIMVMWLLALAVPVQGFAAASMVGCGTGHHGAAGWHSHAIGMHEHAVGVPQHSHDADADGMAQAGHQHHANDTHQGDDHKAHSGAKFSKASCSACASCCTSAALPTEIVVFEPANAPDAFVSLSPQPVASFVSGGPERPPRFFLA